MAEHRAGDRNGIPAYELVRQAQAEQVVNLGARRAKRDSEIDKSMARHPAGKRPRKDN